MMAILSLVSNFSSLEKYLLIGVAALAAFGTWSLHERSVEKAKLTAQYQHQLAAAKQDAAVKTQKLQSDDDAAHKEAINATSNLNAYIAAHPTGAVRVYHVASSCRGVPEGTAIASGSGSPDAGPAAGGQVSSGSSGPDISSKLDTIVRFAGTLSAIGRELQEREQAEAAVSGKH